MANVESEISDLTSDPEAADKSGNETTGQPGNETASSDQTAEAFHETVLKFAGQYSITTASQRFRIPVSTIKRWMKLDHLPVRPKFNSPGQGRKISYSKDTDFAIAEHVRERLARGDKISTQELCSYAKQLVLPENSQFNASTGWAQRFLIRHKLDLGHQRTRREPAQKPEGRVSDNRGRPLSYSNATDQSIAAYVRQRQEDCQAITNSELRKFAKELILKENPNFTGSASWAQNFLLRHKLSLHGSSADRDTPFSSSPSSHLVASRTMMSSNSPLGPPAEITHTTALHSDLAGADPSVAVATMSGAYEPNSSADDPMKAALALLSGENMEAALISHAQAAALQSTLNELSSDHISLVDLLSSAQQLQEQASSDGVGLITHPLDPATSSTLFLGLPASEAFSSGLTGAAATQVNPNTQAPSVAPPPHSALGCRVEAETGQASRPLSYTKETDLALAKWVQEQQTAGKKVTFASLRAYAKRLVTLENPNFNASVGWVTPFLLRHNLDLSVNKKRRAPGGRGSPLGRIRRAGTETEGGAELEGAGEAVTMETLESGTVETEPIPTQHNEVDVATTMAVEHLIASQLEASLQAASALSSSSLQPASSLSSSSSADQPPATTAVPPDPNMVTSPSAAEAALTVIVTPKAPATTPDRKCSLPPRRSSGKGQRRRHPLSEKLEVIKLMREHGMAAHHVCRMLGIANSTLAGWIKLVQEKGAELEQLSTNKKRANVSGQGRPLSYSKEKDEAIARWVRAQQELGAQVAPGELTKYATSVIDSPVFTASSGWQQKFLLRHSLQLAPKSLLEKAVPLLEDSQSVPAAVQTEEVVTHEFSANTFEKAYSDELDEQLAQWVRSCLQASGSLSVQALCLRAEETVVQHNPIFVATLGWAFRFLHRHNLMLDPKPAPAPTASPDGSIATPSRKRAPEPPDSAGKKPRAIVPTAVDTSMTQTTGNLCEALLALSSQAQQEAAGEAVNPDQVQAAMQAVQSAVAAIQQQSELLPPSSSSSSPPVDSPSAQSSASTYFGKPAREFSPEEKEEVVRYANATTLQKAALKYGVAAPTVWRWRVELKLHQPKYTNMQKKYIIKFAETNSLKEASQRYGITGKTIQNWRKALQADGELPLGGIMEEVLGAGPAEIQGEELLEAVPPSGEAQAEAMAYDGQNFQFIVDGGEVVDSAGGREGGVAVGLGTRMTAVPLEVTSDVDIENVGMEFDVVSSEGHAAKPRCTLPEKKQILQFAIEHSIKEASQKFGVSQGTLYYWKKSLAAGTLEKRTSSSALSATPLSLSTPPEVQMNVPYPGLSGETTMIQAINPASQEEGVAIADQFIATPSSAAESVHLLSQTLAALSPEALQHLPTDINLLQAVSSLSSLSSLLVSSEGEGEAARKESHQHKLSSSGEISSPTEVLVTPFQPASGRAGPSPGQTGPSREEEEEEEELMVTDSAEVVIDTLQTSEEDIAMETVSDVLEQPAVAESVEVDTSVVEVDDVTSQPTTDQMEVSDQVEVNDGSSQPTTDVVEVSAQVVVEQPTADMVEVSNQVEVENGSSKLAADQVEVSEQVEVDNVSSQPIADVIEVSNQVEVENGSSSQPRADLVEVSEQVVVDSVASQPPADPGRQHSRPGEGRGEEARD